jgi:hypothetical protein
MKVGKSVMKSIDDWTAGDPEGAILHACNAIDGTAKKIHKELGNAARFKKLLRDHYSILGPMGTPGIDIVNTRFPLNFVKSSLAGENPDLADIIYSVHRCTHSHGDELPEGFDLIPDATGPTRRTRMEIAGNKVRLSDRIIFGLLAIAVLMPENIGQSVPQGYHLTYGSVKRLEINDWWGRVMDFQSIIDLDPPPSLVKLDFGDWLA